MLHNRWARTGAQRSIQFGRLSVWPQGGQGQTGPRALADLKIEDTETSHQAYSSGPMTYVPNTAVDSYREAGLFPVKSPTLLSGQDLRQNKELVFVSFKKGFDKDISLLPLFHHGSSRL